ncbi:TonB-dependent receptor plug domain-containing protein [Pseudoalteromonas sp. ZZD1]|uniref:TonB-dependent receptor plug domain-containing protein n=1 Tax=Pseudoalteromonas sp. ZZD1 TaxID=3139395 RepID=UPI003BABF8F3
MASLFAIESDDLFTMQLEDLLEVQVDIASKTPETIASAPSTITIFNEKSIQLLGVESAYELMNFVPGMHSTRGDWVGAVPKDHARGVYLDSGNILVMINGERINESSFGKASVYMPFIPIEVIDKVEFIRGPGSALYGSNAFLGVMNIITKHTDNTLAAMTGTHGKYGVSASVSKQLTDDLMGFVSIAINQKEGENYPQGVKDPLQSVYFEFGLDIAELELRGRYNQVELDEFINLAGYSKQNQHNSENSFVSLAYSVIKNATTELATKIAYSDHKIASAGLILAGADNPKASEDFLLGPDWQTTDLNIDIDYSHHFNNDWVINAGYEYANSKQISADVRSNYYDQVSGEIIVEQPYYLGAITTIKGYAAFKNLKATFETHSLYSQLKLPLSHQFTLFVGGRYDDVKHIDSKLSPRIAAIYQPSLANTVKLQYGESFRTPVTNELYSNDDVTIGNTNLKSEYVKTTELVWRYQAEQWHFNTVFFHNQLNDFIITVPHASNTNMFTFENQLNDTNRGIEVDTQWHIAPDFSLTGTYTQYFDQPMNPTFKRFASFLASFEMTPMMYSVNTIWRDEVNVTGHDLSKFSQPSYLLFGATISYELTERSNIALKADNLFDKQYNSFDPRVGNGAVAGVSREISLHYRLKF